MKNSDKTYKIAIHGFLICLVLTCMPVMASAGETEVPLYIKYRYEKETGRKWYDASKQRQDEFIAEELEKTRKQKLIEARRESIRQRVETQKLRARKMKALRRQKLEQARLRRKEKKQRIEERRKAQLRRKKAKMVENMRRRKKGR